MTYSITSQYSKYCVDILYQYLALYETEGIMKYRPKLLFERNITKVAKRIAYQYNYSQ